MPPTPADHTPDALPWELAFDPLPSLLDALNTRLRAFDACAHVGTHDGRTWQATVRDLLTDVVLDGWPAGGGDAPVDAAEALRAALDAADAGRLATLAALQAAHPAGVTIPSPEAFDDAADAARVA